MKAAESERETEQKQLNVGERVCLMNVTQIMTVKVFLTKCLSTAPYFSSVEQRAFNLNGSLFAPSQ